MQVERFEPSFPRRALVVFDCGGFGTIGVLGGAAPGLIEWIDDRKARPGARIELGPRKGRRGIMGWTSRIVEEAELSDALAREILGLLEQTFPSRRESQAAQFYRNGVVPSWRVLIESPRLVGHLATVDRSVRIGSTTLRVAGIHGVCVSSDRRGGGIGSELISSAISEAFERDFEIAMLFTRKPEVYVSAGFRPLEGSVSRALPARIGRRVPSWMGGRRCIGVENCGAVCFGSVGQTCMWRPLRRLHIPRGPVVVARSTW